MIFILTHNVLTREYRIKRVVHVAVQIVMTNLKCVGGGSLTKPTFLSLVLLISNSSRLISSNVTNACLRLIVEEIMFMELHWRKVIKIW